MVDGERILGSEGTAIMQEIQVAIAKEGSGVRVFYIAEDDGTLALRMLRKAHPDLGKDVQLYPQLNEAAGKALGMKPGDVTEWKVGETINATAWFAGKKT